MKSIVKDIVILSGLLLALACEKVPKYSEIPEISYDSYDIQRNVQNPLSKSSSDVLTIRIKYKDGNGDLGYTTEEIASKSTNNYIVNLQRKENGIFKTLVFNPSFDGKFPKLNTDKVVGPIDGTLNRIIVIEHFTPITPNDTIRFDIKIVDNANNVSNTITTPSIIVYQ